MTHELIMTKWWRIQDSINGHEYWDKVFTYSRETREYGLLFGEEENNKRTFVDKEFFKDRQYADLPPV